LPTRDEGYQTSPIARAAREHGVVVHALSRLHVEAPAQSALMLGFSGYPHQTIAPAIARLAQAFERSPALPAAARAP
jgi:GntR family transcriptional regulator/MocR family aminotransferase